MKSPLFFMAIGQICNHPASCFVEDSQLLDPRHSRLGTELLEVLVLNKLRAVVDGIGVGELVLLDLLAAFNTFDHDISLHWFSKVAVGGNVLRLV